MKRGLVLEGGAMRGMFTCGVLDVFMEEGISFDGAVGVSAGATFGCNIKTKQIGRALRYNRKYCGDKRYCSWYSWLTTGDLYNVKFCYEDLPYKLDRWDIKTFKDNPMDFYCVVTDVETGKAVYHKCTTGQKDDIVWIQASASMPVFSKPVAINGGLYLDGGMSDSIPLKFLQKEGYEQILVIETQPLEYRKEPQKHMGIIGLFLRKYPKMIETMKNRYLMYNEEKDYIRDQEEAGNVLVIRPKEPLNIGAMEHNKDNLQRVYDLGRKAAKEFLKKKTWVNE